MILATDVAYDGDSAGKAVAAGVLFETWQSPVAKVELVVSIDRVADYVPGEFYRRELPCLQRLLEQVSGPLECVVVDGYVTLGAGDRPGLGLHLWRALEQRVPVIGVAKTAFDGTPDETRVFRGDSARPLFVTAAGLPQDEARALIAGMHGQHRLPTLLKRVDQLCRAGMATAFSRG